MRQPSTGRRNFWFFTILVVIGLACGAAWAGGVVYVQENEDSDSGWLGVKLSEETDDPEGGARVEGVVDGSPAEEAGIEEGDVIQGFEGHPVRGPRGLSERVEDRAAGDVVSIRLIRDGQEMTLDVELGERGDFAHTLSQTFSVPFDTEKWENFSEKFEQMGEKYSDWAERFGESGHWENLGQHYAPRVLEFRGWSRPKLGVQLSDTTPELREHFGGDDDSGVLISKVMPDMPAADAGLEVGDLIVAIDSQPVASAGEIVDELRDKEGETFVIDVIRDGKSLAIEVTIPEPEDLERPSGPRAWVVRPAAPAPPVPPAMPEIRVSPVRVDVPSFELPELPPLPELPEMPALPAIPALATLNEAEHV